MRDSNGPRPRRMPTAPRGARALSWLAAAGAAFALSNPAGGPADAIAGDGQETFRVPGDRVAIYNLAGRVEVRGGEGSEVSVAVRRGGSDADRLRIERGPVEGFETLRVVYPDDRIIYRGGGAWRGSSNLRVREDGTFYGRDRDGRKVTVASNGRGLEAHADLSVVIPPGKSVGLYLAVGAVTVANVDGELRVDVGAADVSASGTRGSLIVDTGSGDVTVSDVEGDLMADTGSGDVEAREVRGEDVVLDTGSGRVSGSGISATRLVVDTGSGDVQLSGIRAADVRVDTGSGDVTLALLTDVESLEVDTGSGSVELRLPDGFGARVKVETGSGGIDFDVPLEVQRVGRSHLEGRIGDGRGRVEVDTGSGSVTLRRG